MTVIPSNLLNFALGETWRWSFTADTPLGVNLDGVDLRWRLFNDKLVLVEISLADGIIVTDSNQHQCVFTVPPSSQLNLDQSMTLANVLLRHETRLTFAGNFVSIQCPGQFILRYSSFLMQNIVKAKAIMNDFSTQSQGILL